MTKKKTWYLEEKWREPFSAIAGEISEVHGRKIEELEKYGCTELTKEDMGVFNRAICLVIASKHFQCLPPLLKGCTFYGSTLLRDVFIKYRHLIPREQLYDVTTQVYVCDGFDFPKEPIIALKEIRPPDYLEDLPDDYKHTDEITVYRASNTPPSQIEKVYEECSWSTDPNIAMRFYRLRRASCGHNPTLYGATIRKENIIAYVSPTSQCEVIQCGGVENVEVLSEGVMKAICDMRNKRIGREQEPKMNNPFSGEALCKEIDEKYGLDAGLLSQNGGINL